MLDLAHIPVLVVLFPLLMAAVCALLPFRNIAWLLATASTGMGLLAAWTGLEAHSGERVSYALGGWPPPWGIEFVADGASLLVSTVVAGLSFISTIYAKSLIEKEIEEHLIGKAYAAWLLAVGGIQGIVMTGDAFNLFVFLEISSLATVTLISLGGRQDRRALIAAYNYLVIGAIGATFYVIGVGFCYAVTGTLNMADLMVRLPDATATAPLLVGFSFMVAGILVKAAVFPVHIWLPAAYGYAPSAVSTMLAAVATKASIYVLARIAFTIFDGLDDMVFLILEFVLLPLSVMAIFVGTILAIMESDLKKLLAQSSIAQIGYITLGFSLGNVLGVTAGFVHIVNHALIKGGLFMAAGALTVVMDRRVSIDSLAGMGRAMPITSSAMMICGLSLIGLPLTAGFISKVYLVLALVSSASWWIIGLVVMSSALSLIYLWRIVEAMWMQPMPASGRVREDPLIYTPLWVIALINIWFGVDAGRVFRFAEQAAKAVGAGG